MNNSLGKFKPVEWLDFRDFETLIKSIADKCQFSRFQISYLFEIILTKDDYYLTYEQRAFIEDCVLEDVIIKIREALDNEELDNIGSYQLQIYVENLRKEKVVLNSIDESENLNQLTEKMIASREFTLLQIYLLLSIAISKNEQTEHETLFIKTGKFKDVLHLFKEVFLNDSKEGFGLFEVEEYLSDLKRKMSDF